MKALVLMAALAVQSGAFQGRIEGRVLDGGTGAPIPGATIRLDGFDRRAVTDQEGSFILADVPEGRWMLTGAAEGFEPMTIRVLVPDEGAVRVDLELVRRTQEPRIVGRVIEAGSTQPVPSASIRIVGGAATETDEAGRFALTAPRPGPVRIRSWAYGYAPADLELEASSAAQPVEIRLRPRPVGLQPVNVRSAGATEGGAAERRLYDVEPRPGVVGIARAEIRDVPPMVEVDVLRSLQALPGVVQVNDLSARLHVRGGGPDQNLYLMDGARILAPYHMFGIFGAFNSTAVSRVDFFRGDLPARHGGALSSVVDIEQRDQTVRGVEADLVSGVLSNSAAVRGRIPGVQGRWLVAGRVSTVGPVLERFSFVDADDFPFSFDDIQARVSMAPSPDHRVSASYFGSNDQFRMFLTGATDQLGASWANRAGSLRWLWDPRPDWSTRVTAWSSSYRTVLETGVGDRIPVTENEVRLQAGRIEAIRRGDTSVRVGAELQSGDVRLDGGNRTGGFVEGSYAQPFDWVAAYIELERQIGPFRLAPGVRVEGTPHRDAIYAAPRLSARWGVLEDLDLTVGWSRSHQALSTLRDDRYALPGPPLWFSHRPDEPVSRVDGVSATVDGWLGRLWSLSVGGFSRRFTDLPVWRPEGDRRLDDIQWDRGGSRGLEVVARRHGERLHGWLSYGFSRTVMTEDNGDTYRPTWDRAHAVDLAVFAGVGRFTVGSRVVYGSGTPFWGRAGTEQAKFLAPSTGKIEDREGFPVWGAEQQRFPDYFRADLMARARFRWGRVEVEPYAGLINLTARPNVVYYDYQVRRIPGVDGPSEFTAKLRPESVLVAVPSLGFELRF